MSNTQNEQAKINTSFEENFIDENIKMDTDGKFKAFVKKFMKRKTAVVAFFIMVFLLILAIVVLDK